MIVKSLIVLTVALFASSAFADNGRDRWELVKYNFSCDFGEHRNNNDENQYKAYAKVFAYVDEDLSIKENTVNKLAILQERESRGERSSELVYANEALLNIKHKAVVISGIEGKPVIYVLRDEPGTRLTKDEYKAFLLIKDDRIKGDCKVNHEEVHQ